MNSFLPAISKRNFLKIAVFVCTFSVANTISSKLNAQGNLLVTPKRVVFEGSKRSEELNLANVGKDSATYVISFVQMRMKADGTFEEIAQPDSAQYFADKNLRFFPRTVTLAPNEAQTVKVQLTKLNELTAGEYRSHIYFRAVPRQKALGEEVAKQDSSISVKLVPIFGISIPAIIRVGEQNASVQLSDVKLKMENENPLLNMTFKRNGNVSVYGDISVDHVSEDGRVVRVGNVKGMAVYTPNPARMFRLNLEKKEGVNYNSGKLLIRYADQTSKANTLAEYQLVLNQNLASN